MKRIKAACEANPRKALLTLCALLVATGVIFASGANFNSTSANPSNTFTAGTLTHSNSLDNAAILSASNMKPGDNANGTVDITNTGSLPGVFTLSKTVTAETAGFASKLTVAVTDCKADGCGNANDASVYSGSVSGMASQSLGTFAAGELHRYKFVVTFPDGGSGGADNSYQSASTTVRYNWESVNN